MRNPRAAPGPQGTSVQPRERCPLPPGGTSDIALLRGTATPARPAKSTAGVIPSSQTGNRGSNRRAARPPPRLPRRAPRRAAPPARKSPRRSRRDALGPASALSGPHCRQPPGRLAGPSQGPGPVGPSPRPRPASATEHHGHTRVPMQSAALGEASHGLHPSLRKEQPSRWVTEAFSAGSPPWLPRGHQLNSARGFGAAGHSLQALPSAGRSQTHVDLQAKAPSQSTLRSFVSPRH